MGEYRNLYIVIAIESIGLAVGILMNIYWYNTVVVPLLPLWLFTKILIMIVPLGFLTIMMAWILILCIIELIKLKVKNRCFAKKNSKYNIIDDLEL